MAAAVVYEGVGGGRGTLFEGMKFWVAQRVPLRNHYLDRLKENGGEIVRLEKDADMLIADHAKGAPPGSYSYKYIDASIKNGQLENMEDHIAGPSAGSIRPVGIGSRLPTKQTRTPFTPVDDRVLRDFVIAAERQGVLVKGNIIYQQLATINPRHTAQSWRDRWIKYLQYQQRPELPPEDVAEPLNIPASSYVAAPVMTPRPTSSRLSSNRSSMGRRHLVHEVKPTLLPHKDTQVVFTRDDYKLLKNNYDDILNLDPALEDVAWKAWASDYPQHSAEEWHDYWTLDVFPFLKEKKEKPVPQNAISETAPVQPTLTESNPRRVSRGQAKPPINTRLSTTSMSNTTSPKELSRGHSTNISRDVSISSSNSHKDPNELEFRRSLKIFAEAEEYEINMRPKICGRTIYLYHLWEIVNNPEFGGFADVESGERWAQVATKMGFNSFRTPSAPNELRDLYDDQLFDYEASILFLAAEVGVQSATVGDVGLMSESPMEQTHHDDDDLDIPSSAPRPASKKRSFVGRDEESDGSSKRRRSVKGKQKETREIPSTPEPNLLPGSQRVSPLRSEELSSPQDISEVQEPLYPRLRRIAEPETQDFSYPIAEGTSASRSSPFDSLSFTSPSKQIQLESSQARIRAESNTHEDSPEMQPTGDSSTQSQTDAEREAHLNQFMEQQAAIGYSDDIIITALQATTLDTSNVTIVLEALARGDELPENVAGVWTSEDDEMIAESEHSIEMWAKHGAERCQKRREYLRQMDELSL